MSSLLVVIIIIIIYIVFKYINARTMYQVVNRNVLPVARNRCVVYLRTNDIIFHVTTCHVHCTCSDVATVGQEQTQVYGAVDVSATRRCQP